MKEDVLIQVEGLSKKFCKDLKTSLWYGIKDLYSNVVGNKDDRALRPKEFWALKDINFELKRGECLGLIGHNGAGKSTLLKILNGLIMPDSGKVTMRGRVGALIELGAGFNPILTGRENIYNNGAVLGFSKSEIDSKLDDIIDFAEIREFIDMPVQNYSSGMRVRLGFAVAAQMEPDILIIDEVLAVGDVSFRAKCYKRISALQEKCCVIFVTHNMPQLSKICTSATLLNKGELIHNGAIGDVIEKYYDLTNKKEDSNVLVADKCELTSFNIEPKKFSNYEESCVVDLVVNSSIAVDDVEFNMVILSRELVPIAQGSSKILKQRIPLSIGENKIRFALRNLNLNTGVYNISLTIDDINNGQKYFWSQNIEEIQVVGDHIGISPILIDGKWEKS